MTLKLYQKDDLWYFCRLGIEYCLGEEISKTLSLFDSIEESKVFHIKILSISAVRTIKPIASFRFMSMYHNIYPFGYVESFIFNLTNDCPILKFPEEYNNLPGRFYISKIW